MDQLIRSRAFRKRNLQIIEREKAFTDLVLLKIKMIEDSIRDLQRTIAQETHETIRLEFPSLGIYKTGMEAYAYHLRIEKKWNLEDGKPELPTPMQ